MTSWATAEGLRYPLGVSGCPEDGADSFALYSKHATSVRRLLLADDLDERNVPASMRWNKLSWTE
jgi:hypothetical protein